MALRSRLWSWGFGATLALCSAVSPIGLPRIAWAAPDIPDLDSFTAVDLAPYRHYLNPRAGEFIDFSTPDGLSCQFRLSSSTTDDTDSQGLNCRGAIPGVEPATSTTTMCPFTDVRATGGLIYHFSPYFGACDEKPVGALLPAGSKISDGNITCAVGAGELTVCSDVRVGQRHGFVLRPSGSTAF